MDAYDIDEWYRETFGNSKREGVYILSWEGLDVLNKAIVEEGIKSGIILVVNTPNESSKAFFRSSRNDIQIDSYGSMEEEPSALLRYFKSDGSKTLLIKQPYPLSESDLKLYEERKHLRKEQIELQDKIVTKDGHFNPNRVHINCHSSKINNRERSKKKRQQKKRSR